MISTGRKVCRRSDVIVGSSPEPPLKVGMITLTEALPPDRLVLCRRTPNNASDTRDSVNRGMSNISTEKASRSKLVSASCCTISSMRRTSDGQQDAHRCDCSRDRKRRAISRSCIWQRVWHASCRSAIVFGVMGYQYGHANVVEYFMKTVDLEFGASDVSSCPRRTLQHDKPMSAVSGRE